MTTGMTKRRTANHGVGAVSPRGSQANCASKTVAEIIDELIIRNLHTAHGT